MQHKIGIFPGTFDPVHDGHIGFCLEAMEKCGLDRVYLLPEPRPRGKPHASHMATRIELLRAKTKDSDKLAVLTLTTNTFAVSKSLPQILKRFQGDEITFLMGSDIARGLYAWQDIADLLRQTTLAIGLRGDDTPLDLENYLRTLYAGKNLAQNYTLIQSPHPNLSSTLIREQAFA
jgi:nicotinate-nucleotide adenylyltransferase